MNNIEKKLLAFKLKGYHLVITSDRLAANRTWFECEEFDLMTDKDWKLFRITKSAIANPNLATLDSIEKLEKYLEQR